MSKTSDPFRNSRKHFESLGTISNFSKPFRKLIIYDTARGQSFMYPVSDYASPRDNAGDSLCYTCSLSWFGSSLRFFRSPSRKVSHIIWRHPSFEFLPTWRYFVAALRDYKPVRGRLGKNLCLKSHQNRTKIASKIACVNGPLACRVHRLSNPSWSQALLRWLGNEVPFEIVSKDFEMVPNISEMVPNISEMVPKSSKWFRDFEMVSIRNSFET